MNTISALRSDVDGRVRAATGASSPSVLANALTAAIYLHHTSDATHAQSHRGGHPHGVSCWPTFGETPQLFLLALRLSEARAYDLEGRLPSVGWLNFFIAAEVVEGMAPLDACAVIYNPDESAPLTVPPVEGLCVELRGLTFGQGIHSVMQSYEFRMTETYDAACTEFEALGFNVISEDSASLQEADYLLGKQMYATAGGIETMHDPAAFVQQRHGHPAPALRALLTLRRDTGAWSFLQDNSLMSLTYFIELGDLTGHHFDRVVVDATAD